MKRFRLGLHLPLVFLLALAVLGLGGCKSPEADNESARPWNTPQGWGTGLPVGMGQNR